MQGAQERAVNQRPESSSHNNEERSLKKNENLDGLHWSVGVLLTQARGSILTFFLMKGSAPATFSKIY
jgi:hypothetical protein